MSVTLRPAERGSPHGVRPFTPEDEPALGELMFSAYVGTVDYEGESPEEAAMEIRRTIEGQYGPFLPEHSRVALQDQRIASAALITRFNGRPLVAYTFTAPESASRGLARACMEAAMASLYGAGERELGLYVTLANDRAVRLYSTLGFRPLP